MSNRDEIEALNRAFYGPSLFCPGVAVEVRGGDRRRIAALLQALPLEMLEVIAWLSSTPMGTGAVLQVGVDPLGVAGALKFIMTLYQLWGGWVQVMPADSTDPANDGMTYYWW